MIVFISDYERRYFFNYVSSFYTMIIISISGKLQPEQISEEERYCLVYSEVLFSLLGRTDLIYVGCSKGT